jgi:hypothetical protein
MYTILDGGLAIEYQYCICPLRPATKDPQESLQVLSSRPLTGKALPTPYTVVFTAMTFQQIPWLLVDTMLDIFSPISIGVDGVQQLAFSSDCNFVALLYLVKRNHFFGYHYTLAVANRVSMLRRYYGGQRSVTDNTLDLPSRPTIQLSFWPQIVKVRSVFLLWMRPLVLCYFGCGQWCYAILDE